MTTNEHGGAHQHVFQALAQQHAPKGIRVNVVAPGTIWTPMQTAGGQSRYEAQAGEEEWATPDGADSYQAARDRTRDLAHPRQLLGRPDIADR